MYVATFLGWGWTDSAAAQVYIHTIHRLQLACFGSAQSQGATIMDYKDRSHPDTILAPIPHMFMIPHIFA